MEHEERLEVSSRPSTLNYALPFELLGEIFSHISGDPLDLRYVIFVCRSWHNAAVHHANLWTNILLGYTFQTRFQAARLPHGVAFVRLCKSRSSPLPLHISVHDPHCWPRDRFQDWGLYHRDFFVIKDILDSNPEDPENLFQRCRSLSWTFVKGSSNVGVAERTFVSASFPALEYMTIEGLSVSGGLPWISSPRLPRLKEVTLINHSEDCTPPFFHDDDFANAERLTFIVQYPSDSWKHNDVACIRRFRNIRILILNCEDLADDYDMETLGDKPVVLSLLETLTLSGYVHRGLLDQIRAPCLRRLEIEGDMARCLSYFVLRLVHLVGSLERLSVSFSEGIYGITLDEGLEELIAAAPSLVSVWVSPWMVQYLMGKEWCTKLRVMDPK